MILDALIVSVFFAGLAAVLAIPWMHAPSYTRYVDHGPTAEHGH